MQTIRIERLGAQGDGVAEAGVFAPFTLPGETVRGEAAAGRIARPEILEASPHRTAPPCPHFGTCGGCALQHASDAFLAGWKRDQIASALAARGLGDVEIRETIVSPPRSRRRATFAARRTKKTVLAGFHGRGDSEIIPIDACHLVAPALLSALPAVEDAARLGASRKKAIRALATTTEGGVDLAIEDAKPLERQELIDAAALAERYDLARLSWNGEVVALRRPPAQPFGDARVEPAPGGFLQATREGEEAIAAAVVEAVGEAGRIADLFAGCGAFALRLAVAAEVLAIEGDAAAVAALEAGWRRTPGLKRVSTEVRDLFRRPLLPIEMDGLDAIVIDPPRAGAEAQCVEIAKGGPPVVAAVSCNPATFGRDARILVDGGYRLEWAQPVDQFRWSPHTELAALFRRT